MTALMLVAYGKLDMAVFCHCTIERGGILISLEDLAKISILFFPPLSVRHIECAG